MALIILSVAFSPPKSGTTKCSLTVSNATGIRGTAYARLRSVTDVAGCCAACEADAACGGWELSSKTAETPVCNLKGANGTLGVSYPNPLCTSGRPAAPPIPKCPGAQPPRRSLVSSTQPGFVAAPTEQTVVRTPTDQKLPHVFMFLQDDLGYDDVAFNGNDVNLDVTRHITAAAKTGIILRRHYVHWHCSPSRRSFLTGRLPLHHSEFLSPTSTGDDIDLRWTTIAQKLKGAGYATYWFGKGHTGYKSFHHLPLQLGFDAFTGFLGGAQDHFKGKRWEGNCPMHDANATDEYSATLYGARALATLDAYDAAAPGARPLFFYLPWQNVHAPYQAPMSWGGDVLRGMLAATDAALGDLVAALKAKPGMWENSVLFYSADNGGTDRGSNWPLRGTKHSNWEGGLRAAAFVSGGRIPPHLRGTSSDVVGHIADWYATICGLAGVDASDDSPTAPLPVDPADPRRDIYANGAWPGVDGVDLWPHLVTVPDPTNASAAHPAGLWLSAEVFVLGDYKLVVAQQDPAKTNSGPTLGWRCGGTRGTRCNTTVSASCGENPDTKGPKTPQCDDWVKATPAQCSCGCAYQDRATPFVPCLFDVRADPSEFDDVSADHMALRTRLWRELNRTNLEQYQHRADTKDPTGDPTANRSPARLVGPCNATCAATFWARYTPSWAATDDADAWVSEPEASDPGHPICGVPGCTGTAGSESES